MRRVFSRYKVLIIIILVTVIFIWGHSMFSKEVSSGESSIALAILRPVLEIFAGKGNVTEYLVRKLAHFSEYAVLGGELGYLMFGIICFIRKSQSNPLVMAVKSFWLGELAVLVTAFLDETIQIFSGRGPMITDVWIDLAGGACGALIILLIRAIRRSATI